MSFLDERAEFEGELEAHYASYPTNLSRVALKLEDLAAQHGDWSPARLKAAGYDVLVRECPIKIFCHFPFYHEIDVGKPRTDLGGCGLGAWFKNNAFGRKLTEEGKAWWKPYSESGLSAGWLVLDDNHHCGGTDTYLRHGLNGLLERVRQKRGTAATEHERDELDAMAAGLEALKFLANRFADEAARMAAVEKNKAIRVRLERMADTARRVPANPPATFYEATCAIQFMREAVQSIDTDGISILGHLDRLLDPYYRKDIEAGRITPDEAREILSFLLAFSDVRFGMRTAPGWHNGTNTTVMTGGCDSGGRVVYNDITRMILDIYRDLRLVDPKLNARISPDHPAEYAERLADLLSRGLNSVCVFNDDVIIPANVRMGKAIEDCRLYVGGGCQENVLENTEVNSRASIYLNMLAVLRMGFNPAAWKLIIERDHIPIKPFNPCATFDDFYDTFLANLKAVVEAHVARRNKSEAEGWRYNPCPMHSTLIEDCITKARDVMEGGARYNFGSVSLDGVGTLVDSLYAVRTVVYRDKQVSLADLGRIVDNNFEGEEVFRQYLLNRVPKFGQDNPDIREFAAKVFADIARVSSGMPNSRGGKYEASLFSFTTYMALGFATGATPDGRKAGEPVSQGMSPSTLSLGRTCSVGQVLDAMVPLDMTLYPVVAVLDLKMPLLGNGQRPKLIASVIRRFLASGGSVLQLNCIDADMLKDARQHPERHRDLVVRVSGYSAYFASLSDTLKDEIIARTLVTG